MSGLYNRTELAPFTRATAEQVNAETAKIESAINALQVLIGQIVAGTPLASYTWVAFADSADGTANFTAGEPGERGYIGLAYGRAVAEESAVPSDYIWTRFRGADGADGTDGQNGADGQDGADGSNGADGDYRDLRFKRASTQPATPVLADPAGWDALPPEGSGALWFTVATKSAAGDLLTVWSTPARLDPTVNRGPYRADATYYQRETVTFNGGTYILAAETSTGNAPSGTAQANAWWDVVAAPGNEGAPATPPSAFSATVDLTASSNGANLRTIADAAGYTGMSDATITFNVPTGVTIQGVANGGRGIDTGTWPSSSYTIALTLVVQSGGKVFGGGGRGGSGDVFGLPGLAGGDAIYCREGVDITIDSGGEVAAGGGGGGGGRSSATGFYVKIGGGGGGGGFPNGSGGAGGAGEISDGSDGSPGTISGGGNGGGGGGSGGKGGDAATAGSAGSGTSGSGGAGGAAGYAVRKNGFTVPVTNNGSMTGTAA